MLELFKNYQLIIFDWEGTLAHFGHPIDQLYPETKTVLATLASQNKTLAIATGKGKESLLNSLKAHELMEYFTVIATASEFPAKPEPSMLNHAINYTGSKLSQVLMVGDSTVDVLAAAAAGVDSLLLTRTGAALQCTPTFTAQALI